MAAAAAVPGRGQKASAQKGARISRPEVDGGVASAAEVDGGRGGFGPVTAASQARRKLSASARR